jgi:hypothetical protein
MTQTGSEPLPPKGVLGQTFRPDAIEGSRSAHTFIAHEIWSSDSSIRSNNVGGSRRAMTSSQRTSEQSGDVTGRVFEAGDGILKIAEGWHAGPGIDPIEDPNELGPQVMELMSNARPNADIWGRNIVS